MSFILIHSFQLNLYLTAILVAVISLANRKKLFKIAKNTFLNFFEKNLR